MNKPYRVIVVRPDGKVLKYKGDNVFLYLRDGGLADVGVGVRAHLSGIVAGDFCNYDLIAILRKMVTDFGLRHVRKAYSVLLDPETLTMEVPLEGAPHESV